MNNIITCTICHTPLKGKQKKFCSLLCKNKAFQSYGAQQARGLDRKKSLIKRFGGCCCECGYSKNLAALTFHHIEPSKKELKLDMRSLSNRTQSRVNQEAKKCKLLCSNCHAELHNPQHSLEWTCRAGRSNPWATVPCRISIDTFVFYIK